MERWDWSRHVLSVLLPWFLLEHFLCCHSASTVIAAAAKPLQSCPTLCDPVDGSPPGSPVPGILQARILEWVAFSFSSAWKWKVKVKSLSRSDSYRPHGLAAYQASPSMGFSRQEYWSGVPLPSPTVIATHRQELSVLFRERPCSLSHLTVRLVITIGKWLLTELTWTYFFISEIPLQKPSTWRTWCAFNVYWANSHTYVLFFTQLLNSHLKNYIPQVLWLEFYFCRFFPFLFFGSQEN